MKFKIPLFAKQRQERQKPGASRKASTQPAGAAAKILVVDDNLLFAKTISLKLEGWGYQVVTALDSGSWCIRVVPLLFKVWNLEEFAGLIK